MANSTEDILRRNLEQLKEDIIQRQKDNDEWASGKTAAGYEIGAEQSHGWLSGYRYVPVLEHGRKPGKVPYGFNEIIQRWMEAKGIQPRDGETIERAARSIAWVIKTKGTFLHRYGYEVDIFQTPIQTFLTNIQNELGKFYTLEITKNI